MYLSGLPEEGGGMTLEAIKEFLRPNWKKIFGVVLFFFLFVGSFIISPTPEAFTFFWNIFFVIFAPPLFIHDYLENTLFYQCSMHLSTLLTPIGEIIFVLLSFFLYWYVLSCLLIFAYDKFKSRKQKK